MIPAKQEVTPQGTQPKSSERAENQGQRTEDIEYDFIKSEFPNKYDVALEEMIDEAIKGGWITKRPSGSSPINAEGV